MLPLPQGEDKGEGMTVKRARYFRKSATKAEKRLWSHLRNRQVAGMKFRRQHPIGHRIVDFFCAEAKLAIELDGSGHHRHFGETHDLDQAIDLYEKGIRLLRFSNHDVFDNLDGDNLRYRSGKIFVADVTRIADEAYDWSLTSILSLGERIQAPRVRKNTGSS